MKVTKHKIKKRYISSCSAVTPLIKDLKLAAAVIKAAVLQSVKSNESSFLEIMY